MKTNQVVFAPSAERDLDNLYAYIADHSGEARAEAFVGRLIDECLGLSAFPERGLLRKDIRANLRTTSFAKRVTVAYAIDEGADTVVVLGVFYGGRDFTHLITDENR